MLGPRIAWNKGHRAVYCKRGHRLTPVNRVVSNYDIGGTTCKTCTRLRKKAWWQLHRDEELLRCRRWKRTYAGKVSRRCRRARFACVLHVPYDFEIIVRRTGNKCAYCLRSGIRLTVDHLIPISRGGPDIEANVLPACPPCNSRKGNRIMLPKFLVSEEQRMLLLTAIRT